MGDITLNSAVRSNLRTMQSTQELMNRTGDRLSTGKKVNSALDNPSNFFTAEALDRRAGDLSSLLDSVSTSVKTLEAADNGLKAINDVVESLKATARSALQSPTAVGSKASVQSGGVLNLSASNLIGGNTEPSTAASLSVTFGGSTDFGPTGQMDFQIAVDGGSMQTITITGSDIQAVGDTDAVIDDAVEFRQILQTAIGSSVTIGGTGNTVSITSNTDGASSRIAIGAPYGSGTNTANQTGIVDVLSTSADGTGPGSVPTNEGKTLTVKDRDGVNKTLTLSATGVNTLDELNQWFDDNDVALSASVESDGSNGKLKLEASNAAAWSNPPAIAGSITTSGGSFNGHTTFSTPKLDPAAAEKRANFVKDYNESLKQIATLARDSSFNGVNLLQSDDLDITFNEDGTSRLDVKGVEFDARGLGLEDIAEADFYDADSVNKVIDKIEAAFDKIEAQSSKFGSQLQIVQTRQSFTKDMVGTLEDGALALIGADTNEEAANLATLQTRQSLIVSSLSISTQQESNVLQLLR